MTDLKPTAEQQVVVDAAQTGQNLVIQAGAGTGKTSTLQMVADVRPRTSLYVAYNKAIATDAGTKFPRLVTCKTSHSLAFAAEGRRFSHRLNQARRPSWEIAKELGLGWLRLGRGVAPISGHHQVRIAQDTVRRFCYSADTEIGVRHVPFQNGIVGKNHSDLCARILPLAQTWWEDVQNPNGLLPFEHDHYLKIWALTNPMLPYDVVYLDEAQDSNPMLAKLVQDQTHAQQIVVGDGCQQMYSWRGAVDALKNWPGAQTLYLSQSWRFGQVIADEANKWLSLLPTSLELVGNPGIDSTLDDLDEPSAVLCRTNAGAMAVVLRYLDEGMNVALVGGGDQLARLARACADLREKGKTSHPELFAFSSWEEVSRFAREESGGRDLLPLVNLIDEHGTEKIIEATQALVSEDNAQVTVSTAHKAKGREWPTVQIHGDFFQPREDDEGQTRINEAEAMIGYVAVTRARQVLDRAAVAWIDELVDALPPEADEVAEQDLAEVEALEEILALPAAEEGN